MSSGPDLDVLIGLDGIERRVHDAEALLESMLLGEDSPAAVASLRVAAAGGKRLRPALAIACASLGDPNWKTTMHACVAVELVQVGSLVHDDIFEKAPTRRGVPTINAVEGESHALLAGDYILARASEAAARAGQQVAVSVARTVEELCIGQMQETGDLYDPDRTIDSHISSIARKTASLFACSCRVGALCGGVDPEPVTRFGHAFGMAFQILDDIFDLASDEARLGKPVNIDIESGVYTLPVLLAVQRPDGLALRVLLETRRHDEARDAVLRGDTIGEALESARQYTAEAADAVAHVGWLAGFPWRYLDWALGAFA